MFSFYADLKIYGFNFKQLFPKLSYKYKSSVGGILPVIK